MLPAYWRCIGIDFDADSIAVAAHRRATGLGRRHFSQIQQIKRLPSAVRSALCRADRDNPSWDCCSGGQYFDLITSDLNASLISASSLQ